jgi:hypothetical protein
LSSAAATGSGVPGTGIALGSGGSSFVNTPLVFALEDTIAGGNANNKLIITTYYTLVTIV